MKREPVTNKVPIFGLFDFRYNRKRQHVEKTAVRVDFGITRRVRRLCNARLFCLSQVDLPTDYKCANGAGPATDTVGQPTTDKVSYEILSVAKIGAVERHASRC